MVCSTLGGLGSTKNRFKKLNFSLEKLHAKNIEKSIKNEPKTRFQSCPKHSQDIAARTPRGYIYSTLTRIAEL